MKVNKTGADGTMGLALGERIKVVTRTRAFDGDGDTAQDAHSWSDREERDGYEVRMQEKGSESPHSFSWTVHQRFPP